MFNRQKQWYHGSPLKLKTLRKGSTITQDEKLAQVFSTKPTIVSVSDGGTIKHNGKLKGRVYIISDVVTDEDIYEHPWSTMPKGWEWLTNKPLKLEFQYEYTASSADILTKEEIKELKRRRQIT